MGIAELLLVAAGLSMDAFAVAVCKGLTLEKKSFASAGIVGLYFGVFQALMPLAGYWAGVGFRAQIEAIGPYIASVVLFIIGIKMIVDSGKEEKCDSSSLAMGGMLALAVATSLDALAVGISFAFLSVSIGQACAIIGLTAFVCSVIGVQMGCTFGEKLRSKAEWAGGLTLVAIGIKIIIGHLL